MNCKLLSALTKICLLLFLINVPLNAQESASVFNRVESGFTYTSDLFVNTTGGFDTGVRYMDNIDVTVGFVLAGFDFFLYGMGNQGSTISELTGDIQLVSNIAAQNSWRIFEAWTNKTLPSIRSSMLFGLYDLNSEFDVINTGQLFINSSHGIGPDFSTSGVLLPSVFPLTSLTLRLKISPTPGVLIKAAVLDAVPSDPGNTRGTKVFLRANEGALITGEISFFDRDQNIEDVLGRGTGNLKNLRMIIGGWKYSVERTGWLGEPESDHGVYAILESRLYREKPDSDEGLYSFLRAGAANRDINRFNYYLGGGLTYTGLFRGRENDQLGLALSLPVNSDDYIEAESFNNNDFSANEMTTEFTYRVLLSDQFTFQINTQYIMNPNRAPGLGDALAFGLRSIFRF